MESVLKRLSSSVPTVRDACDQVLDSKRTEGTSATNESTALLHILTQSFLTRNAKIALIALDGLEVLIGTFPKESSPDLVENVHNEGALSSESNLSSVFDLLVNQCGLYANNAEILIRVVKLLLGYVIGLGLRDSQTVAVVKTFITMLGLKGSANLTSACLTGLSQIQSKIINLLESNDTCFVAVILFCSEKLTSLHLDKEADAINHWLSFLFELLSKSPPHHSPEFIDAAQNSLTLALCHLLTKDETKGKPVVSFKIPKLCIQRCCFVANQMVRHFGSVPQMTSSIASIFHHLIIDPSVQQRIIPIVNSLNEIVSSKELLLKFAGPKSGDVLGDVDVDLFRQLLPAVVETAKLGGHVGLEPSVLFAVHLLSTITVLIKCEKSTEEPNSSFDPSPPPSRPFDGNEEMVKTTTSSSAADDSVLDLAEDFLTRLSSLIPSLVAASSVVAMDEAVQDFASGYFHRHAACSGESDSRARSLFLSADVPYAAAYASLLLSDKLARRGHYDGSSVSVLMIQVEFRQIFDDLASNHYVPLDWTDCLAQLLASRRIIVAESRPLSQTLKSLDPTDSGKRAHFAGDDASRSAARALLDLSWPSLLEILAVPLRNPPSASRRSLTKRSPTKSLIPTCLDGLTRGARLCAALDMQSRCSTAFELMVDVACADGIAPANRLVAAHALCMEVLLDTAVTCDAECWSHVFKCCAHVAAVERALFASGVKSPTTIESTVADLLLVRRRAKGDDNPGRLLDDGETASAVCILTSLVDALFRHAADVLNLNQLRRFVGALCSFSRRQLFANEGYCLSEEDGPPTGELSRIAHVLMKCADDESKPLIFVCNIWNSVADYLVEAACHSVRRVAKASVSSLHTIISSILTHRTERSGFSTQETLLRPLENLIALQMCDGDTQHQVISSLCDLVEQSMDCIQSGWQSVFRTLRAVRTTANDAVASVALELIAAVLRSGKVSVFSAAAVPCVQCLVKLVADDSHALQVEGVDRLSVRSCLTRFAHRLASVNLMRAPPKMRGANRIRLPVVDCDAWNDENGIVTVWGLLLCGIVEAVVQCRRAVDPALVAELRDILVVVLKSPDRRLYVMALVDVVLASIGAWVQSARWDDDSLANFCLAFGSVVEMIVDSFRDVNEHDSIASRRLVDSISKVILVCLKQEEEKVARLGCSTFRHFLVSCGALFDFATWQSVSSHLSEALSITRSPIVSLIRQFAEGDGGIRGTDNSVQVVKRKDTDIATARRALELAEQVLMYGKEEMQGTPETERKKLRQLEASSIACHSLHLVISTSSNADEATIRLSSRRIVVSLLVHQLLLQFLHEIFFGENSQIPVGFSEGVFPSVTSALKETIVVAIEFEARPGLRLLLQKTLGLKKGVLSMGKEVTAALRLYLHSVQRVATLKNQFSEWVSFSLEECCQLVVSHFVRFTIRHNDLWSSNERMLLVSLWENCVASVVDFVTALPVGVFRPALSVAYPSFVQLVSLMESHALKLSVEKFLAQVGAVVILQQKDD